MVYYWKDAGQHGIYLLKKHVHIAIYNKALQKRVFWLAKTLDPFARGLHADASFFFQHETIGKMINLNPFPSDFQIQLPTPHGYSESHTWK